MLRGKEQRRMPQRKARKMAKCGCIWVCGVLLMVPCLSYAGESLTGKQLFSLMTASHARYTTFDANMESTVTQLVGGKPKTVESSEFISRQSGDGCFERAVTTRYERGDGPDFSPVSTQTRASTDKWQKSLYEAPGKKPLGTTAQPGTGPARVNYSVGDAMWNIFDTPWEKLDVNAAVVRFQKETNMYTVDVKVRDLPKSPTLKLRVDPSKGFIPVEREYVKDDGTVVVRLRCTDLRQVEDLWIPYGYISEAVKQGTTTRVKVRQVTINKPIPSGLMDFAFPVGTVVDDQVAHLKYTVSPQETK
jgi:hypothetical protein